jgi:hypothetical protein
VSARWARYEGEVVAMSPEGAGHVAVKYAVRTALLAGIRARELRPSLRPEEILRSIASITDQTLLLLK